MNNNGPFERPYASASLSSMQQQQQQPDATDDDQSDAGSPSGVIDWR